MTGEPAVFTKLGAAAVRLSRLNVVRRGLTEGGGKAAVIRKNSISLVEYDKKKRRLQLRASEDISFDSESGPFRLEVEVDGFVHVKEPLVDEDLTQEAINEIGESLLLPFTASIIASATHWMSLPPLILPPFLEEGEGQDEE